MQCRLFKSVCILSAPPSNDTAKNEYRLDVKCDKLCNLSKGTDRRQKGTDTTNYTNSDKKKKTPQTLILKCTSSILKWLTKNKVHVICG